MSLRDYESPYTPRHWKVKRAELLQLPTGQPPRKYGEAGLALTAAVHTIRESEILSATCWKAGERLFTVFIDKEIERDLTMVYPGSWSEGSIRHNMDAIARRWNFTVPGKVCLPPRSAAAIAGYFGDGDTAPIVVLDKEMLGYRSRRYRAREDIRKQRIDRITGQRKPLPRDFDRWVDNHLMLDERYIIYAREGKHIVGACTHCHKAVALEAQKGMKHGAAVVCPSCGSKAKLASPGRYRRSDINSRRYAIVANRIDEGLLLRCIHVRRTIILSTGKVIDDYHECAMHLIHYKGNDVALEYLYKHNGAISSEGWDYAVRGSWSHTPAFQAGLLYTANLHNELRGTPWQYSALELLPKARQETNGWDISGYLDATRRSSLIERLMRVGLYSLAIGSNKYYSAAAELRAHDFVTGEANKLHRLLGVRRADLPVLRRLDITAKELKLYAQLVSEGRQDPSRWIRALRGDAATADERVETITSVIRCSSTSAAERLIFDYAPKQQTLHPESYENVGMVYQDYRDYLGDCIILRRDLEDTSNLWPNNLPARHHQTTMAIKRKKTAVADKAIRHRWKAEHEMYEYSSGGYMVVMPRNQSEIITEGKLMCHCVGGYADRAARGDTTILFVRAVADRLTPLATAEVIDGKTKQIRAAKNHAPDEAVAAFWAEYEENVLRPMREGKLRKKQSKNKVKAG